MKKQHNYTVMHWGTWQVESSEGEIVAVKPVPQDKNPSRIGQSLPDAVTSQTRIRRPAVRAGYLQHGPASREGRGKEPFVEVSWEVAWTCWRASCARSRRAAAMRRSTAAPTAGPALDAFTMRRASCTGFSRALAGTPPAPIPIAAPRAAYSAAYSRAAEPAAPAAYPFFRAGPGVSAVCRHWWSAAAQCPVNGGGANDHMLQYWLDKMQANGTRFINISPVRNDLSAVPDAEWLAIRPGTDTALLLALSYVLIAESLYDQAFVASHTVGFAPIALICWASTMAWRKPQRGRRRLPAWTPSASPIWRGRWPATGRW